MWLLTSFEDILGGYFPRVWVISFLGGEMQTLSEYHFDKLSVTGESVLM